MSGFLPDISNTLQAGYGGGIYSTDFLKAKPKPVLGRTYKPINYTPKPINTGAPILDEALTTQRNGELGIGTPLEKTELPDIGGKWMEGGKLALQGAQIGLGVYSALEQSKMNKFMQGYYGNQMAQGKVDFNNNVDSANFRLSNQLESSASAAGFAFGSKENKDRVASGMDQWGAKKFNG